MPDFIQSVDWAVLHRIQNVLRCEFMDSAMKIVTHLGDKGFIWIAAGLVLLFFAKYRKDGIVLWIGLLVGLLVFNVLLKNIFMRDRPCWIDTDFVLLIPNPKDFSFPSGHTGSSVIAATILTMTDRKFGYAAIPLAILIAFSRLYLYVHFPSDVLVSAVLGVIIGAAVKTAADKLIVNKSAVKPRE